MPKKIDVETKEKAIQLRKSGFSYASISEKLGVSVVWCKTHLSNIESSSDTKFKELLKKSKSQKGVTVSEVAGTISREGIGEQQFCNKLQNTISKIRKESEDNIVREDWMLPKFAEELNKRMTSVSFDLDNRLQEEVELLINDLIKSHPTKFKEGATPCASKIKQKIIKTIQNMNQDCHFYNGESND